MLDWGLRLVVLLALPCAVALVVFGQPMLAVLFHHGRFTAHDVVQSAGPLMGYGAGLLGIVAVKVLAPGYYARQDVRTPVRIAIAVLLITQAPQPGAGAMARALGADADHRAGCADQCRSGCCAGCCAWACTGPARVGARLRSRSCSACAALGATLAWAARAIDWLGLQAAPWSRAGLLAAVLGGVALLYFGVLVACGVRLREFMRRA